MNHSIRRHLSISIKKVRRHRGDSFARQVAYICRTVTLNPRTGRWHDYRGRGPAEAAGLLGWDDSVEDLIEEAVFAENQKRKKVVEGRVAIVAIPDELSERRRLRLVQKCAEYLVRKFKVAVVYAIHPPSEKGDQRNWHAHLLFTSREVVAGKALGRKTRELDSLKTGGENVEAFRAWWTSECNWALRQAGFDGNCEHRSFLRLGVNAVPGRHKGERLTAIARRQDRAMQSPPIPFAGQAIQALAVPNTSAHVLEAQLSSSPSDCLDVATATRPELESNSDPAFDDGGPATSGRPELPTPKPPQEPQGPSR